MESADKNLLSTFENVLECDFCIPIFVGGELYALVSFSARKDESLYTELELGDVCDLCYSFEYGLRNILIQVHKHQSQITSEWAHDLARPFGKGAVLSTLTNLMGGKYGSLGELQSKMVETVFNELLFPARMIKQLIRPDKNLSGIACEIKEESLRSVYLATQQKYEPVLAEKGLQLKVIAPQESEKVLVDSMMVQYRVIYNLIENALRYTKTGEIELGYMIRDNQFIGYVKDTGCGIPKDQLEKIFEAGAQIEGQEKGAAGLGLTIIKKVMQAHQGKVWTESEEGKGSTFFFMLSLIS